MKDPKKEIEYLKVNPITTDIGGIGVNAQLERPSIELNLSPFPDRKHGSLFLFSPEEWIRAVELIREYFRQESIIHSS